MINIDADLENADWIRRKWDLPPYKSVSFMSAIPDLERFRQLPVYQFAVKSGLIVNDEWVGSTLADRMNAPIIKGDYPGHPFRGNQWTTVMVAVPEEMQQAAKGLSKELRAKAVKNERVVTSTLKDLAKQHGGKMVGLQHRLKKAASLARKIGLDAVRADISVDEAAAQITDALRFTMTFPPEMLQAKVAEVEGAMIAQGWSLYDHKVKNMYDEGRVYEGYNTVWMNKDGYRFELQFHTPDSFHIKEKNHKLYELFRVTTSEQVRASTARRMIENWSKDEQYVRPANHVQLGSRFLGQYA